ncbi:MAG: phage tail tape measure protein [Acidobacteriota bacterium]|nr:phage tail tape measure protein [Acidobacteriota bacterium]
MATIGTVNVKITGDISGLVAQLKAAGLQVEGFDKRISRVGDNTRLAATTQARGFSNLARAFTNAAGTTGVLNSEISILASSVGNVGLVAAGAGIGVGVLAAGLGASIVSAISFESAITKVAKTANFSAEETKAFGNEILEMSRRLPVATNDLTSIAEIAGQLGIQGTSNIASFVEEVAKLSSTTGVATAELAPALGSIIQVSGLAITEVNRVSSAITELGNTSNSTEQQILDYSVRLAGVAKAVGAPIVGVLGLSSAFAAAGVESERGATAIQKGLLTIDEAATEGGEKLQLIADVAGLTVDAFVDLEATRPDLAFARFVEGLGGLDNATAVLEALELADVRVTAAFLSVGNAVGGVVKPIEDATQAAVLGTATNEEFGRSSETTAAKIQIMRNKISATATDIGTVLLPAVNLAIDAINKGFDADLGARAKDNIQEIVDAINGLGDGVSLEGIVAAFQSVDDKLTEVKDNVSETYNFLRDIPGTGPIYELADAFIALGDAIANVPKPDLGGLGGFVGIAKDALRGGVGAVVPGLGVLDFLFSDRGNGGREPARSPLSQSDEDALRGGEGAGFAAVTERQKRDAAIPPGLTSGGGSSGGGGPKQLTALEAAMDGIITRSEALTLGLTDAQVIALELAVAENKVADEEFRRRIELQALAQAYPGLTGEEVKFRLGLEAIAEHLALTGKSIEQFVLETSTTLLEGFQSAFAAIFNKPTKEDSQLQLQLLEAQRRKLLLGSGGSDSQKKALDAEIERIQNLIAIRRNADEITKTRAEIADNTALTDQAQAQAAELYIAAIETSSAEVEKNTGIVFLQTLANIGLKDQTLALTTAFANLNDSVTNAAATGSGLSLADALVALAALPDGGKSLLPAAALGIENVERDMTVRVHRGERIIPAFRNQTGESGQPINITSYITVEGDATDRTVELIKKAVREEAENAIRRASFRGSYVTSGAYTPS